MNDTVIRLMELTDKAIAAQDQRLGCLAQDYRQALQEELTKLFEPVVEPGAYHYKYLNHIGEEVWSLYPPRLAQVLETQALYASPTPPANVPLLTDREIIEAWNTLRLVTVNTKNDFARAIEQAVRQKAGLK